MNIKQWYSSKTIWIALAQGALAVTLVFSDAYPEVGVWLIAKTFLDILVRYLTKNEIVRF